MKLWPRRHKVPTTRYWVNGYGPFETAEERDRMHETLREVAEWNRQAYARALDNETKA